MRRPLRLTLAVRKSADARLPAAIRGLTEAEHAALRSRLTCRCAKCMSKAIRSVRAGAAMPPPITVETVAVPPGTVPCRGGSA